MPAVLSIAGSDSGGGAGVQADLKTFAALGVFGTTAITCVTAQNPDGVDGIAAIEPALVRMQIRSVCRGFPVAALKTGMLYSAPIIQIVAQEVRRAGIRNVVVDPVMIATSGARLLQIEAMTALQSRLLPLATVVTPNLLEAEVLAGGTIRSLAELKEAARAIATRYRIACVVKGGHLPGNCVIDVLCTGQVVRSFRVARQPARETHGTGCTFSAALAAFLAHGQSLAAAVANAQRFVATSLARARRVGNHYPLLPVAPRTKARG